MRKYYYGLLCFLCILYSFTLPAFSDTSLQPGDTLSIFVRYYPDFNAVVVVREDYKIFYPYISEAIDVRNLDINKLKDIITDGLKKIIKEPVVTINVTSFSKFEVYISGEVKTPGKYEVRRNATLMELLILAGLTDKSDYEHITLLKDNKRTVVNMRKFLSGEDMSQNITLEDRVVVYVPMSERTVIVTGSVKTPGSYVIKPGLNTVMNAVDAAGGPLQNLYPNNFTLIRQNKIILTDDLAKLYKDANMSVNIELQSGDTLLIISQEKAKLYVSISGQVEKPGLYEIKEGDRVLDVILLAGGITKEAVVDKASVVRRNGEIVSVNLDELMINGNMKENVLIQGGDTVLLIKPGKRVVIAGDVKTPGVYSLEENAKLLDALAMGGAYKKPHLEEIGVFRTVDGKSTVIKIDAEKLFDNPASDLNISLQKGDIVYIPENGAMDQSTLNFWLQSLPWFLTTLINVFRN